VQWYLNSVQIGRVFLWGYGGKEITRSYYLNIRLNGSKDKKGAAKLIGNNSNPTVNQGSP
jgi:hypothetical protein